MSSSESEYVSDASYSDELAKKKPSGRKASTGRSSSSTSTPPLTAEADKIANGQTNGSNAPKGGSKGALDQYQKLSQLEHILKRPDTYIGSVERSTQEMWVYNAETDAMAFSEVTIVPGLYKIFDEILVNAADNKIRDPQMRNIRVSIDAEANTIEVMNDGRGIPVEIHDKEQMYIPELIFGNLLTSSNYDDDQRKVTGGRNGFGAKLCNIFSTEFVVETADLSNEKLYRQVWTSNMSTVGKPKITKMKSKREFTKITFKPDLAKFGMERLDPEILSVMRRRVYDLCGTVKDCNVYLNDKKLPVKNFKGYVEMYVKAMASKDQRAVSDVQDPIKSEPLLELAIVSPPVIQKAPPIIHEVLNDRWELAFAVSDGSFNQISFVNSIATTSGGTHVKYVSDQVINKLVETLNKRLKGGKNKKLLIKPAEVRNHLFVFINCLIENPAFTSQTKEQLTTKVAQFGSKVVISDQFINKIIKSTNIEDKLLEIAGINEDKQLQKADGSKKQRIKGQVKLVDANKAGTRDGYKCTLILTEGDSALALAVAGLAVVGRDHYGCFPLRGKLLNVREALTDQVSKNAEINALKQIIGLQHKKHYSVDNVKNLRYGHIMIMTDQDQDGSHIKGLIINFLESSFPGLIEIPGFLLEFITPIVKVTIGRTKQVKAFYSMPEFEKWRNEEGMTTRWSLKYYKGLGTSTDREFREYFKALDKHLKTFHALQEEDKGLIDLAFLKKKADDRKEWLQNFVPGTHLDPDLVEIPISDFINKELILFSMADNVRSIPSVLDGFKPGQRKVLFGLFKKNLKTDIKVMNLAGYISDNTGYHHGEASLMLTIIGLAQDFVGSNNINLLKPNGSFGTRAQGGKDHAAPRYIFTDVMEITKQIFNPLDNALYKYVQDDEQTVEPEWYLPILPMLLVNGGEGIGTGWSTNIPSYNPVDIVSNIRKLMANEEMEEMVPWYRGWEGDIIRNGSDRFKVTGRIEQIDENTLEITELPIKMWTNTMKEFLLSGLGTDKISPWIKDMEEQHGMTIRFVIKLSSEEMAKSLKIGLMERFRLVSSISLSNMVAFDSLGRIKRYDSPLEILKEYFYVRLEYYQRRKDHICEELTNQLTKLSEQARFIKMIIEKQLSVSNKKRSVLVEVLQLHKFVPIDKDGKPIKDIKSEHVVTDLAIAEELLEEEEEEAVEGGDVSQAQISGTPNENEEFKPTTIYAAYDYLLGMSIWSLTRERYEKIMQQRDNKKEELTALLKLSAKDLWNNDLDAFLISWEKFLQDDLESRMADIPTKGSKKTAKRSRAKPSKKGGSTEGDNSEVPPKKKQATVKKKLPSSVGSVKPETVATELHGASTPLPPMKKPAAPKVKSLFDDSEDEELLGGSFSALSEPPSATARAKKSSLESKVKTPLKATSSRKKPTINDELADLTDTAFKLENPAPRRRAASAKKPQLYLISDDDDNDDEIVEVDMDDESDYEE